ncbi:MAG: hypothetical protein JNL28_00445 [Planctomycetes bacterium]|nr:hypothetical protein [Planctomycetota bacterium]
MLSLFLALTLTVPADTASTATVLHMPTTGAAVRIELPELVVDSTVIGALKRRHAERAILQGQMKGETTIMILSAYGLMRTSQEWRAELMKGKLAGHGQFDIGTTACTETSHDLEPPYSNISRRAFITMGDTCFDISMGTLAKSGVAGITREEFEAIIGSARYAILRLGVWDDMPDAVLNYMHTGLARVTNDGATHLAEQSKTATDGWACALAAAEIGGPLQMKAGERRALYERVMTDLGKLEHPGAKEAFALMTAMSGRALTLCDDAMIPDALAEITKTLALPAAQVPAAQTALEYIAATIHAQNKDAAAAVASLTKSIAGDSDRRSIARHDLMFQPIGNDPALLKLLRDPK